MTRKRKWWVIPLIVIGALYLSVSGTVGAIKHFHQNKLENEASRWLDQAQQDAKPTWSEDDAVSWFRKHDFEDIGTGNGVRQQVGKPDEHYLVASAFRQFEDGGLIVSASSIYVEFYFDLDHRFQRVSSETWPFKPPGRRRSSDGK